MAMAPSSSSSGGGGGDGDGAADPMALVQGYTPEELAIAGEFLTTWLPFLSAGLCPSCTSSLRGRVDSLLPRGNRRLAAVCRLCGRTLVLLGFLDQFFCLTSIQPTRAAEESPPPPQAVDQIEPSGWDSDPAHPQNLPFEPSGWDSDPPPPSHPPPAAPAEKPRMSWADMAQEDELAAAAEDDAAAAAADDGDEGAEAGRPKVQLTREQREQRRLGSVVRNKDFRCYERVHGQLVNILAGLELHAGVFSAAEQRRIVQCVYDLQARGHRGELGGESHSLIFNCLDS